VRWPGKLCGAFSLPRPFGSFWGNAKRNSPKAPIILQRIKLQFSKSILLELTHSNPNTGCNPFLSNIQLTSNTPIIYHSPQSVTTVRLSIILTYPVVDNNAQRLFIVAHLINKRG
jgi:hypothetical protein